MTKIFRMTESWAKRGIVITLLSGMSALMAACGGGGTASNTTVGGSLQVLPASVDMYADQPVTFTISGGTKPYSVFSSNANVLPLASTVSDTTFVAKASNPTTDTAVTITVRDNAGATTTASANVKAATLDNAITITPATVGVSCGNAVCAGGDALVSTTSTLNGVLLFNRSIRFDVYAGEYSLVTPGTNALVTSVTLTTDAKGVAQTLLRANAGAKSQTAIIQVTDVTSGLVRRFSFGIQQQTTSTEITVTPNAFTWTGAYKNACAIGAITSHYIFGGTPPYRIQQTIPNFATMAGSPAGPTPDQTQYPGAVSVAISGGAVLVSTTGLTCSTGANGDTFVVTDSQSRTATFTIGNTQGTADAPASGGSLAAPTFSPASPLGPLDCGISASTFVTQVIPSGYTGTTPVLTATSLEPNRLSATLASGVLTVTRLGNGPGGVNFSSVRVSNGTTFADLVVNFSANNASFSCNVGSSSTTPVTTNLPGPVSVATGATKPVTISGGTAPFTVTSASGAVATVSLDGFTFGNSVVVAAGATPAFIIKGTGASGSSTFITVTDSTPAASGGPLSTVIIVSIP